MPQLRMGHDRSVNIQLIYAAAAPSHTGLSAAMIGWASFLAWPRAGFALNATKR